MSAQRAATPAAVDLITGPVIVRKYGNRRLYRTDLSRYVTLDELAELVHEDVDFIVEDAKTGEDLTRIVLAQVVLELQKRDAAGAFPIQLLRQIIRLQDSRIEEFLVTHVPRLLQIYTDARDAVGDSMDVAVAGAIDESEAVLIGQLAAVRSQLDSLLSQLEVADD